ncbi:MAG: hypothetical protein K2J10_11685 [Muribaculaceae bacterium]|nr:hypothetical protein [Muribaculaceae bacterium]
MRKIVLILFSLIAISIHAQELSNGDLYKLENDTISWGNSKIVLSLPNISIKRVQVDRYEEGFFRFYTLIFPDKPTHPSCIILHCGALAEFTLPQPDKVIYKCKLGNVANSFYFMSDGKYYRRDNYNAYGIRVFFYSVAEEDLEFANSILDNLKIYNAPKK